MFEAFVKGTAPWRTDLYSGPGSGALMSHQDSIQLFQRLGVKMTPELKEAMVPMPFEGFTQQDYAQKMLDEYKVAGVPPSLAQLQAYKAQGIRIVAPPIFALLDVKEGRMTASTHAKNIQQAGLKIIAWSLERSGVMATDRGGWYYQTVNALVKGEGEA